MACSPQQSCVASDGARAAIDAAANAWRTAEFGAWA